METVTLKNGSVEPKVLVDTLMRSLKLLLVNNPIAFYELVMKCRDRNHRFFGTAAEPLKNLALVQADGDVHSSIRNVVLSAVSGEMLEMTLGSPV